MSSGKGINNVNSLIKMCNASVVSILYNLLKWCCVSRRYAKQTKVLTKVECKIQ